MNAFRGLKKKELIKTLSKSTKACHFEFIRKLKSMFFPAPYIKNDATEERLTKNITPLPVGESLSLSTHFLLIKNILETSPVPTPQKPDKVPTKMPYTDFIGCQSEVTNSFLFSDL